MRSVVPSEDAHQSEYTAEADKRREWITKYDSAALDSFGHSSLTNVNTVSRARLAKRSYRKLPLI